ncbi:MAG: hypothetical protein EXR73_09995 [Myxococcales bacterium]|nr:hypothetical protein [Myxococcales bacterium]
MRISHCQAALVAISLLLATSAHAEVGPTAHTHNFIVPTGETLPAGSQQLDLVEFGLGRAFIGVTDRVEVAIALYGLAGGSVGARVALLPRDQPLRLVVSGAAYFTLAADVESDGPLALQGSVTAAHQTARSSIHGTISAVLQPDKEYAIGFLTLGVSYRLTPRVALMAEYVRTSSCDQLFGDCRPTIVVTPMAGVKVIGADWDLDLGVIAVPMGDMMSSDDGSGNREPSISFPLVRYAKRY